MISRVVVSIAIFCFVVVAYFKIDSALDTVRRHAPKPEEIIQVGERHMTQIDVLCQELLPKVEPENSIRTILICSHQKRLVPMLFVVASLTGWCASIWLIALQHKAGGQIESRMAFIMSFMLAALSGIICYLVLLVFPVERLGAKNPESAALFPLLAGLFLRVFFDRLRDLLSTIFDKLTGKKAQGDGDDRNRTRVQSLLLMAALIVLCSQQVYALGALLYFRCGDPKDECIAFSEDDKLKCPQCKQWIDKTLALSELFFSAKEQQESFGVRSKTPASNYFISATAKEVYDLDITAGGAKAPPKTAEIYKDPERFGFRELGPDEAKAGSIALFGNLAGLVVKEEGKEKIVYPSATTHKINSARPEWLAEQKNTTPKYVVPIK